MAIIIKEIHVSTVVEKKVVQTTDIPERVYQEIKEKIIRCLSQQQQTPAPERKKNER